uniref:Uncharacterized protein n=1 Tax=Globodera rostochiensis TaxID=31243 RepID=A0A914H8J1_GLORO
MQHRTCAFWSDLLRSRCKSDQTKNVTDNNTDSDHESLKMIAETVLMECIDQRNVSVGCLAAEFLFRNGDKHFDAKTATNCPITMSGYLNSLVVKNCNDGTNNNNNNANALCHFLAHILLQFDCRIPLHSLGVLVKIVKAHLHDASVVEQTNTGRLIQLWHQCFYLERGGPNELNKLIAKNMITILQRVGPPPNEVLFKHLLFRVPHFIRHKYLLMQYLLSDSPLDQLDEPVLLTFFDQLASCLEGRGCQADLADAFHALAIRFLELGKSELLMQLISKTLHSNNGPTRENAIRLWLPKLNTSQQLRQMFVALLDSFRVELHNNLSTIKEEENEASVSAFDQSPPYWDYGSFVDPCVHWTQQQINLWSFVQLFYWTAKNRVPLLHAQMSEDVEIVVNALIYGHKDEIKQIAADSLLLLLQRPKQHLAKTQAEHIIRRFASHFEHLMRAENAKLCNSVNSLIVNLLKFYDQEDNAVILLKCRFQQLLNNCTKNIQSPIFFCPITGNLLQLIERMDDDYCSTNEELQLDVQNFLLKALVYKNDSTVRQRSALIASRIANGCSQFRSELITLFNESAPNLKYGIAHLYRLILCLRVDERDLNLHFVGDEDGLTILFKRIKFEQQNQLANENDAIAHFLSHCVDVNEKLLQIGGSGRPAQCVTVSELHLLFEKCSVEDGENDDDLLFWSDLQRRQLAIYSNGIIQSCSALRWILTKFTNQIDAFAIQKGLRSIWTVLLRSHHKGVLEHCAVRDKINEKTLSILFYGGGQCRNIAFAKILVPIFASLCAKRRTDFVKKLIFAFNLPQNSIMCAFDQTKLQLHQLFLLKQLVSTTKFDLRELRTEIFQFIIQMTRLAMNKGQTERWRLFSMAGNAFAALLNSIFRHFPDIVPLHNFYVVERCFCDNLLNFLRNIRIDLTQKRRSEPSIALLLVPLQRLFVVDDPFETYAPANGFVAEVCLELNLLMRLEPSVLLRRQMEQVITNFKGHPQML